MIGLPIGALLPFYLLNETPDIHVDSASSNQAMP